MPVTLIDSLTVGNELGEGVIWDHQSAKLWWTDIQQSKLYRYDPRSRALDTWDAPERLCCFAPVASQDKTGLTKFVAAFESGFAFYQPETGKLEWLHKLETDNPGTRFNDGRTDRQGRLWSGTMIEDENLATTKGTLYCLHNDLSISRSLNDLIIPNSLCWSPDGKTVYHTDTPTQQINQYSYDTQNGSFGKATVFAKTKPDCYPDGSIIDADGYLWNAQWGGSRVVRYAPDGHVDLEIEVPTKQPSCVAFGGENLDLLFVTTAYEDLNPKDAQAGDLFIYQTDYKGLIESPFIQKA